MSADAVKELIALLDLEGLETNLFRGRSPTYSWQRVFGGQVIAQALVAAMRTVDQKRAVHSLHCYFLLPGDPAVPIVFDVDRIRDGGSFTTRRVVAVQRGKPIFSMSASFQDDEPGFEHQAVMPVVPQPEDLPSEDEFKAMVEKFASEPVKRYWLRPRPLVVLPTDLSRYMGVPQQDSRQHLWFKTSAPLPEDPMLHRAVLAYLSDLTLLDTALIVHGKSVFDPALQVASLDHALWFHRPVKADDWLLYAQDNPSSSGARGFTRGQIFSRDGRLVASVAQEGLIRQR